MKLTKHFNLEEFANSQTAARMGVPVVIPDDIVPRIQALCDHVLEPLRLDVRRSIWVQSGYRPGWLNKAVGGAKSSQHMLGEAADILVSGMTPMQVCRRIVNLELPFDQLILEFDQWTHVSYSENPRGKILTARKVLGQTHYLNGLVEK
jgi:zinc D-Ala-D-Ala carboxypeptidase